MHQRGLRIRRLNLANRDIHEGRYIEIMEHIGKLYHAMGFQRSVANTTHNFESISKARHDKNEADHRTASKSCHNSFTVEPNATQKTYNNHWLVRDIL